MVIGHLPRRGGASAPRTGRDRPRPAAVHRTQPRGPARTVEHDRRRAAGDRRRRPAEGGRRAARGADPVPAQGRLRRGELLRAPRRDERAPPRPVGAPYFFLKPPTTTVIGPDARCPARPARSADRLGGRARRRHRAASGDLDERDVRAHIAGYTIVNDVGAERLGRPTPSPRRSGSTGPPPRRRTVLPDGPGRDPAWFVDDPQDLRSRSASTEWSNKTPAPRT